jgi:uncharacterized protein (DUF4415 family)
MKRASLAEISRMRKEGNLFHDPDAPEEKSLGREFWAKAEIKAARKPRSVHLKLDPEVFEYFYHEGNGKGHLTRMQNVLKAYVNAHR